MKRRYSLYSLLIVVVALFFFGCKNDNTHYIEVKYNVGKDANGSTIIKANIQNSSGNAMTNINIDFTTPDHRVIQYLFSSVVCAGQNTDVVINSNVETDFIDSYKVNSCETTVCQ